MQLTIAPARHEILWRDGTAIGIHPVLRDDVPEVFLRAVPGPDLRPVIVDLRAVVPAIGEDLQRAHPRDRPGLVFFTLRHRFSTMREFQAAAVERGRVDVQAAQLQEAA
jgi:hypothetical protein